MPNIDILHAVAHTHENWLLSAEISTFGAKIYAQFLVASTVANFRNFLAAQSEQLMIWRLLYRTCTYFNHDSNNRRRRREGEEGTIVIRPAQGWRICPGCCCSCCSMRPPRWHRSSSWTTDTKIWCDLTLKKNPKKTSFGFPRPTFGYPRDP